MRLLNWLLLAGLFMRSQPSEIDMKPLTIEDVKRNTMRLLRLIDDARKAAAKSKLRFG